MKMLKAPAKSVEAHYPSTNEWLESVGRKSIDFYNEKGLNIRKQLGTEEPREVGKIVKSWLVEYMCSGQVVAMVIEGNEAISQVRKLCGNTVPTKADPSTIRGRWCADSPDVANLASRCLRNLIHASGNADEAKYEISLWFGKEA
jgi:nucleoside-diphosphate kinase